MSEKIVEHMSNNPQAAVLFVCEHASSHIPEKFNHLGLIGPARDCHIAWDPGAEKVTRILAGRFNAPVVLSCISRLVYDCNRPPSANDCIPEKSEIFEIPGNKNLSEEQVTDRVETYYRPFEQALTQAIDEHQVDPLLVTIHSFTPVYNGQKRDVEIGLLHDADTRVVDAMLEIANGSLKLKLQRNEPYGPSDGVTHTIRLHGVDKGLLNVMIEVRNDLIATDQGCELIADVLEGLISNSIDLLAKSTNKKAVVL